MERIVSFFGIIVLLLIAYLLSSDRKNISKRTLCWGLGLQFLFTILILGVPALNINGPLEFIFDYANSFFFALIKFTEKGTTFLFGPLVDSKKMGGLILAVSVLPVIIFFSSLIAVLYYLNIVQKIIYWIAKVMQKTMKAGGVETSAIATNIFVGQTEAFLLVRPFLDKLTRSESLSLMVGGMATVAGSVMAAYAGILKDVVPNIGGHLLAASVISAPAALTVSKILIPSNKKKSSDESLKEIVYYSEKKENNIIEAAARGTTEGLSMALNVGAMLISFIALIALVNHILFYIGDIVQFDTWGVSLTPEALLANSKPKLSLELIFSWIFSPLAYLIGIPLKDVGTVGVLLGEKIALNEFVAYLHMADFSDKLSQRSMIITSYALCGFANFSSIGIQIGGISAIAPNKCSEFAQLGILAVIGGTISTCLTACWASIVI